MEKIVGAIILGSSILSLAMIVVTGIRYLTVVKRERMISERLEKQTRIAVSERLVKDGLHKMYADEYDRRVAAETKLGLREDKIKRLEKEVKRLEKLVGEAERREK